MTEKDTAQDLTDFLTSDPDELIGNATGMNADGTVNVRDEKGNSVNAIAATPCTSQPTLVERVNGTWYAFQSPNQVTSDRTLISRRLRPPERAAASGPIKVLFYIQTTTGHDWYIGGDRPTPIKIYSTATLPTKSYLSNTGRTLNGWVVGLQYNNRIINIYPNNNIYICNEAWADLLNWKGCGFWESDFYTGSFTYTIINGDAIPTGTTSPEPFYNTYIQDQVTILTYNDPRGFTTGSGSGSAHNEGSIGL